MRCVADVDLGGLKVRGAVCKRNEILTLFFPWVKMCICVAQTCVRGAVALCTRDEVHLVMWGCGCASRWCIGVPMFVVGIRVRVQA